MNALVFSEDKGVQQFLEKLLKKRGYGVQTYFRPQDCSVFSGAGHKCEKERRCADAIILSRFVVGLKTFDLFKKQFQISCHLPPENKLIIADTFEKDEVDEVEKLGIKIMYLPLVLSDVEEWLGGCERRIRALDKTF